MVLHHSQDGFLASGLTSCDAASQSITEAEICLALIPDPQCGLHPSFASYKANIGASWYRWWYDPRGFFKMEVTHDVIVGGLQTVVRLESGAHLTILHKHYNHQHLIYTTPGKLIAHGRTVV
jgi:hypothetical protein